MHKLESKPFIDQSGNFVIPQAVFDGHKEHQVLVLYIDDRALRVTVHRGEVVSVEQVEPVQESFEDLLAAASTSMDFWDNPIDDEVWNRA